MIFDTHAHYDDKAFDEDRDVLLPSLPERGISLVVNPGCDPESSRRALALAEQYPFVYAAVGIHPEELDHATPGALEELSSLACHPKCVAIGEIGLDYYWVSDNKEQQKELFRRQLRLAQEQNKPVIVHDREAHGDSLALIREFPGLRGVFHCFSGSVEMAEELLRWGWYLGFDGPVTYKNARRALEVLAMCPPERMLIETDSPYLSPVPLRGRRNDSTSLPYVLQKISEIKGIPPEELARLTLENGKRLFSIP